ncbi:MAG: PAS domain S-box protein [Pseudomonadota bacterium]
MSDQAHFAAELDTEVVRALLDVMPGTLHIKDRDLRYCIVNRFYCERWGLPASAFIGKRSSELFNDEHDEQVELRDRHVLNTGRALPFYEIEYSMPQGPLALLATKIPLLDPHGSPTHVLTLGIDISALKRAERALGDSERTRSAMVEGALDPIIAITAGGTIIEFNPAAEQVFGFTRAEVLGQPIEHVVIPPHLRGAHLDAMARFQPGELASRGGRRFETRGMRADGTEFPIEISVAEIPLESGSVFTAFIRDMTAAKAAETALRQQREAMHQSAKLSTMGTLVASIAHELKNPLSVVLGQTVLLEETAAEDRTRDRAKLIGEAAERCTRIVHGFLDMARRKPLRLEPVLPNDVVHATLELVGHMLRDHGVELHLELADGLPFVEGDPHQLGQVLMNLIVNAAQALEGCTPPCRVRIKSRQSGGQVLIEVLDNGSGFGPGEAKSVFEPFYTTRTESGGSGLGLAICSDIIAAHGGSITASGERGAGARFSILLPAGKVAKADVDERDPRVGAAGRVLVVDDESEVVDLLTEILEMFGFSVEATTVAEDAVALARQERFDVVFTDMRMPGMDGRALLYELTRANPQTATRFVCVTGEAGSPMVDRLVADLGVAVLSKPFRPADVRRMATQLGFGLTEDL